MTRLVTTAILASFWLAAPAASAQDVPAEGTPDERASDIEITDREAADAQPPAAQPTREAVCDDRRDDDGDGLVDCADADCFEIERCQAGGSEERTNAACSDWIDNDGDGAVDCDDQDCNRRGLTVCLGSDRRGVDDGLSGNIEAADDELPELGEGMSVEDLIGTHGDLDGERNDYLCADGIDNDHDGRTDCADFGCRFDPSVSICHGTPGLRFSVVGGIGASYNFDSVVDAEALDAGVRRLQLRALGPIPYVEDSFFLMSMRVERSPRVTYVHFQLPLGNRGHYLALNSGAGTLAAGMIISTSKQPLLEAPYYVYQAFEQGNGAAIEGGGPITDDGTLDFRLVAAGGSGEFNGNVGGRFFRADDRNFSWTAGGQIGIHVLGQYNRFNSPFLYTPVPLGLSFLLGAKYTQRTRERYPAVNALAVFQYSRFLLRAENYTKREIEYGAWQTAWNVQTSILLVPRTLLLAADIGQFYAGSFDEDPVFDSVLRRPLDQFQWRVAMHWYWFRNVGVLSAMYSQTEIEENPDRPEDATRERVMSVEAQFRF